ncbi:MAG: glycosyltransferase [Phycisphaerales bacterium]|nr:glycosyltransferase [Phycisphaerales bacterium]
MPGSPDHPSPSPSTRIEANPIRPSALVVLGMHRSGTSMLSRMLGLLGGQLPKHSAGPAADNQTGFWEPIKIVESHDQLLDEIGIRNDTPMLDRIGGRNIIDLLESRNARKEWIGTLTQSVQSEFDLDQDDPIVLKDPRMCRLMPLWNQVFDSLDLQPAIILPLRHPSEIAGSLRMRNGYDSGRSMWLWLDHVLRAEFDTRGTPRVFVEYAAMLSDWRTVMKNAGDQLGIEFQIDEQGDAVDRFVSPEYRHHNADSGVGTGELPSLVAETFEALKGMPTTEPSAHSAHLDNLRERFEELRTLSGAWINSAEAHARQSDTLANERKLELDQSRSESLSALSQLREQTASQVAAKNAIETELRASVENAQAQLTRMQASAQEQARKLGHSEMLLRRERDTINSLHEEIEATKDTVKALEAQRHILAQETKQKHDAFAAELSTKNAALENAEVHLNALRLRRQWLEHEYTRLIAYVESVHTSGSWRLTAPLRLVSKSIKKTCRWIIRAIIRVIERCGKFVKHHIPMSSKTEWALERAFYTTLGPLMRHTVGYSNHQQKREFKDSAQPIQRTVISQNELNPESVQPIEQGAFEIDSVPEAVIVFGVIDWFFRHQRPQHLAEQLALRGHRVFYVSPQFVNTPNPGYEHEQIPIHDNDTGADAHAVVHQIRFHVAGSPPIYNCNLASDQHAQILNGLRNLLLDFEIGQTVSMVQHPAWQSFAASLPNARMVYDCMDHHTGFGDIAENMESLEEKLFTGADLTIVTSNWLRQFAEPKAQRIAMIRNACDYEHFAAIADQSGDDDRPVIGYYGAVADWFDVDLVRKVALAYPKCTVLIVGADTCGAREALSDLANVEMTGEVSYTKLPDLVKRMDVCMIPFILSDLILATNPVKVYEMFAAGKPVVSTDLPELHIGELDGLVHCAKSHDEFIHMIADALDNKNDHQLRDQRRAFAAQNRWSDRSIALDSELASLRKSHDSDPLVSVIVVTWNNLELTKDAVNSVLADESYQNIELVIVDNASSDETPAYLQDLNEREDRVRVILNDENTGFAKGNNIGLKAAKGEYLILLNNDTIVTSGWIRTFVNHLRNNPDIGLLGPVTNNIGNEARVQTSYDNKEDIHQEAFRITRSRAGEVFDMNVAAFFCCIFPRSVYEKVGLLDENFGRGFFEDDDYCQRVRQCGYRICCASDVFVHHHLSAGFSMVVSSQRQALFEENKAYYESKWGTWKPHQYRTDPVVGIDNDTHIKALKKDTLGENAPETPRHIAAAER